MEGEIDDGESKSRKKPVSEDHSQEVLFWKIPTERYRQEKKGIYIQIHPAGNPDLPEEVILDQKGNPKMSTILNYICQTLLGTCRFPGSNGCC